MYQHDLNIRPLLMEVFFIHKTMKLPAVLAELKLRKLHLAVVTDEYGGTMGILTMEDVLEQLVGEIWDETDEIKNEFVSVGPDLYEVSGDLSIYDLFEYLDIDEAVSYTHLPPPAEQANHTDGTDLLPPPGPHRW